VLAYPILMDGQMQGVIELSRPGISKTPFDEADEDVAQSYIMWGEMALLYSSMCKQNGRQRDLATFLLQVVK
jgi:hypothetical protein